ncbi:chaperone protein skp [Lucifera butyrica]|uniref:Chaperone protein skp n=1 Tax=Lucifera butyrica TaxID=1351585 RepID=A0A498RCU7_9FIRM|nr:OmpH family outer membrane protein [Lucifera butyrica]VBB09261.1 chaperone protein skp [Lucifera butyrica]
MKRKMRVITAIALLALAALLGGCNAGTNVGVLDVNRIMNESPKVKQFQDQLNTKGKELSDKLEKQKASLSKEDFQKQQQASYSEFVKTKQDMEKQIDDAIKQALDQVAKEKKLGVVVYKNSVAQGGTDVTDDVLKKMQ